jgi:hypothetical protein
MFSLLSIKLLIFAIMPGLPFEPKIILESYKKGDGRKCTSCGEIIRGMMYAGVIEFMETKFDNMEALNMFVCEKCKKKFEKR